MENKSTNEDDRLIGAVDKNASDVPPEQRICDQLFESLSLHDH